MPNEDLEKAYCHGLFVALREALSDTDHVLATCERLRLKGHAPTFPEVRFCKGLVLPVVDEFTTTFLHEHVGASTKDVHAALRCEGYQTLDRYRVFTPSMSGFSGSPWTRDRTLASKSGSGKMSGANPDFCVRYNGSRPLRAVGEVKFLPTRGTSAAGLEQVFGELRHYLTIKSSSHSDWGHDFGFGIIYCGNGTGRRHAMLEDRWSEERSLVAYFHS